MTSLTEMQELQRQLREEKEIEEQEFHRRVQSLLGKPINDLRELRAHWIQEAKNSRKVDDAGISARRDAELWIRSIDHILTKPRPAESAKTATTSEIDNPNNMDVTQAARYLGISVPALYHHTHNRALTFSRVGSRKLSFTKVDLDVFLAKHRSAANSDIAEEATRVAGELWTKQRRTKRPGG